MYVKAKTTFQQEIYYIRRRRRRQQQTSFYKISFEYAKYINDSYFIIIKTLVCICIKLLFFLCSRKKQITIENTQEKQKNLQCV